MKIMKLTDDEVAVVEAYRKQKHHEEYEKKQAEIRANCTHKFEFDFSNYKTDYYKCPLCNATTTGKHLAEMAEAERQNNKQRLATEANVTGAFNDNCLLEE